MARDYIQLRATNEREKRLAKVKDEAEVDGDSEAVDLALRAYLQLAEIADDIEEDFEEMQDSFNTRDGAMRLRDTDVRRS